MATATRDIILKTLRTNLKCTIKDLAQAADVSPVSVRHHLSNLQAEGMVQVEEMRHGVGRPKHLFSLTEKALELFPTRYYRLTNRILEEMKDTLPEAMLRDLLSGVADTIADSFERQLTGLTLEQRLEALKDLLQEEGFEIDIERLSDQIIIRELGCPYFQVGQVHPEVCVIDQTVIARSLNVPVEQVTCMLNGDSHCKFSIQLQAAEQEPQPHVRREHP